MNARFKVGVDMPLAKKLVDTMMANIPTFPKPKATDKLTEEQAYVEMVKLWHDTLNFRKEKYPPFVYEEAVVSWLSEATADSWAPKCGDIMNHCKKVMDRIKEDPVRRKKMEQWKFERAEWRAAVLTGEIEE